MDFGRAAELVYSVFVVDRRPADFIECDECAKLKESNQCWNGLERWRADFLVWSVYVFFKNRFQHLRASSFYRSRLCQFSGPFFRHIKKYHQPERNIMIHWNINMLNLGNHSCIWCEQFKLSHLRKYIEEWNRALGLFSFHFSAFIRINNLFSVHFRREVYRNHPFSTDKLIERFDARRQFSIVVI